VFWGVDTYSLTTEHTFQKFELPIYLYNNNPFDDVKYLFNKTLLFSAVKRVYAIAKKMPSTTLDEAYSWQKTYENRFDHPLFEVTESDENAEIVQSQGNIYDEIVQDNLTHNILPFVEAHPDTTFYFFFVPNSIRFIEGLQAEGTLEGALSAERKAVETLLQYDNVEIYYFQNIESIILDPNIYIDASHYSKDINDFMMQSMSEGNYRLTEDNYRAEIDRLQEIADQVDVRLID
jgi:hypothetical protein